MIKPEKNFKITESTDNWLNNLADQILDDFKTAKEMGLNQEETDQYLDQKEEERKKKLGLQKAEI